VVNLAIEVEGRHGRTDEVRSLRQWMVEDDELRGRVRFVTAPPEPGTLGGVAETLMIALGPGGVATALASVLITWIRRRTGNVTVKITKPDGVKYELSTDTMRSLSADDLKEITARLARDLEATQ
jgi:hypothetical protein